VQAQGSEGKGQVTGILLALRGLLSTPWLAVLLGFAVGVGLIAAVAGSRKLSTSSDGRDSITLMMLSMMGSMLVASVVLLGYALLAPGGFLGFGLSLSGGFIVGLAVYGVVLVRESFHD
jgi:hypothetical protein